MTALPNPAEFAPQQTDLRTMRYLADPAEARCEVAIEGMVMLFHRPSGLTHVLGSPGPELIALLTDRPRTLAEIAAELDLADAPEAVDLIGERLAELEEAGLVRRA